MSVPGTSTPTGAATATAPGATSATSPTGVTPSAETAPLPRLERQHGFFVLPSVVPEQPATGPTPAGRPSSVSKASAEKEMQKRLTTFGGSTPRSSESAASFLAASGAGTPLASTPAQGTAATTALRDKLAEDRKLVAGLTPAAGGAVALPGFPKEWLADVPNPDGTNKPYGIDPPYNLEYMAKVRARQIFVHTDKLVEFAMKVAGRTGVGIERYFSDAATAGDTLQFLLVGVYARMLQRQNEAELAAPGLGASNAVLSEATALVRGASRAIEEARGRAAGAPVAPQMTPAARRRQEEMIQEAMQRYYTGEGRGGGRGAPPPPPSSRPPAAGTKPPGMASSALPPSRHSGPDRGGMLFPPPEPVRVLTAAELAAAETKERYETDKAGEGEALRDPRVLLMFLLLRGGLTATEIKAVEMLRTDPATWADDADKQRRLLEHADKLERMMLHRSRDAGHANLALEWLEAPQHTGFIFFSPEFTAAVAQALEDVHHLARKPFALELDLMTHAEVRNDFAALVAYHLQTASTMALSRFGPTRAELGARQRLHRGLIAKFKHLTYTMRPARGDDGGGYEQYLAFDGDMAPDGTTERTTEMHKREQYMTQKHRYYTDAPSARYPDRTY